MKHKKFNKIYPYTYLITEKSTGKKYHGLRYANVREGFTPLEDLGIRYFSSGRWKKVCKNNSNNFIFQVRWTFDTVEEAIEHEYKINSRLYYRDDWVNLSYGKNFALHPNIGKLISEGINSGDSLERRRESLLNFIWETEEGEKYRDALSRRKTQYWAELTHEEKLEVLKPAHAARDQKRISARLSEWCQEKDPLTGLTNGQIKGRKSAETARANGSSSVVGRKRNETFNRLVGEMTDEEFENWCQGRTPRAINGAKTRRKKYIRGA